MIFIDEKTTLILIVSIIGIAIINAIVSWATHLSCKILQNTPDINTGILGELQRARSKSDKYLWAGPEKFSIIAVKAAWIIYFIGAIPIYLGLLITGMIQNLFVVGGICIMTFSLAFNCTVTVLAFCIMRKMQILKYQQDHPEEEAKEIAKKKKRIKLFGISIDI